MNNNPLDFSVFDSLPWFKDDSGVEIAEATPQIIEMYASHRTIMIKNGVVMDQTGMIKRTCQAHANVTPNDDGSPYPVTYYKPGKHNKTLKIQHLTPNIQYVGEERGMPNMKEKQEFDNVVIHSNGMWTGRPSHGSSHGPTGGPIITEISDDDDNDNNNNENNKPKKPKSSGLLELEKFLLEDDSDISDSSAEVIVKKKPKKFKYSKELYPYQINHTHQLIEALRDNQCALDASETGTGKTHCAIVTAKHLGYNIVVICPRPVIYTWSGAMELHKFKVISGKGNIPKKKRWGFVTNYEQFKNGNTPFMRAKFDKKNQEMIYKWNKFPEKTLLIVDEIQKAKNYKTQNSQMLYQAYLAGIPMLLLSATAVDKVQFMYTVGYLLDLYRSVVHFKQWVRTKKIAAPGDAIPERYCMQLLHKHIFPTRGSRMTIKDAGDMFPKNYIIWEPYVNKKIKRILIMMEKHVRKIMKAKGDSTCILTEIIRARQECELLKVPLFVETAEDLIAEGKSVAIFLNFCESIEKVAMMLKTDCIIWGDNKDSEERERIRLKFVNNKSPVIVCNIASGGVGISLHDTSPDGSHPRVSLINPTWSAQDLKQTLGRIYRAGCKSKCIQKIFYSPQTVEEQIMDLVKFKIESMDTVNDGSDGMMALLKKAMK